MGMIYNLQKFCLHDGPGVRTVVFLKGCPLNCLWCHNPESQNTKPDLMLDSKNCRLCQSCVANCPSNCVKINNNQIETDRTLCATCFECLKFCAYDARKKAGQEISSADLFKKIYKDRQFFEDSNGGVTFSGGEPLCQPEFLYELLRLCKEYDLHTTVDTCGFAGQAVIAKIADLSDLFLYDLKHLNSAKHKSVTGVENQQILANLACLISLNKRIWLRIPVIPGVNDKLTDWQDLPSFIKPESIEQINLLPYHNFSQSKYSALGRASSFWSESLTAGQMDQLQNYFTSLGFRVKTGG